MRKNANENGANSNLGEIAAQNDGKIAAQPRHFLRRAIAFTGKSGSGKTTLVAQLARRLIARGFAVAIVKHDPGDKARFDSEGKDSFVYSQLGANVGVVSPTRTTIFLRDGLFGGFGRGGAAHKHERFAGENFGENGGANGESGAEIFGGAAPNSNLDETLAQNGGKNAENLAQIIAQPTAQNAKNPAQNGAKNPAPAPQKFGKNADEMQADLRKLAAHFGDFDYLLVEGLKFLPLPRLCVVRGELDEQYLEFARAAASDIAGALRAAGFGGEIFALDEYDEIIAWINKNAICL